MDIREIANLAKRCGYDLITIEAMGPQTLVTCEKRMSGAKEPWVEELDANFNDLEFQILAELSQDAYWDARPTSKGIRVFGKQSTGLDAICNAPNRPKAAPMLGLPKEFAPQGVHRDGFNVEPEKPKPPKHRYYPIY